MASAEHKSRDIKKDPVLRRAKTGAVLLAIAVVVGALINFASIYRTKTAAATAEASAATPKVTIIPARPSSTPTPTPTVSSIRLYAFGEELGADGFTAYVGDKPLKLSVKLEPDLTRPPVYWSVSDSPSVSLTVSDDRLSCEFTVLKPSGKNELIVSCYGAETVIPIYLWER